MTHINKRYWPRSDATTDAALALIDAKIFDVDIEDNMGWSKILRIHSHFPLDVKRIKEKWSQHGVFSEIYKTGFVFDPSISRVSVRHLFEGIKDMWEQSVRKSLWDEIYVEGHNHWFQRRIG